MLIQKYFQSSYATKDCHFTAARNRWFMRAASFS